MRKEKTTQPKGEEAGNIDGKGRPKRKKMAKKLPINVTLKGESIRLLKVFRRRPLSCELSSYSAMLRRTLVFLPLNLSCQSNICDFRFPFAGQLQRKEGRRISRSRRKSEERKNEGENAKELPGCLDSLSLGGECSSSEGKRVPLQFQESIANHELQVEFLVFEVMRTNPRCLCICEEK
jgi:hypothetical protein